MSNFNDLYDHVAADRSRAMQLLGIQDIRRKAIAELDELDVISSNIIQDHVQELEKFQWFMRSHLA